MTLFPRNRIALALAAGAVVLAAAPAFAAPGPGMGNAAPRRPANQAMARPGQFILNGDHDTELVRFTKAHDMSVCLPAQMDIKNRPELQGFNAWPITVKWDNDTGVIWPGNCLAFDAARVTVSPSPDMPKDAHVMGQVFLF